MLLLAECVRHPRRRVLRNASRQRRSSRHRAVRFPQTAGTRWQPWQPLALSCAVRKRKAMHQWTRRWTTFCWTIPRARDFGVRLWTRTACQPAELTEQGKRSWLEGKWPSRSSASSSSSLSSELPKQQRRSFSRLTQCGSSNGLPRRAAVCCVDELAERAKQHQQPSRLRNVTAQRDV